MTKPQGLGPEIGEFLRARRARISPRQAGISPGMTRRRVPGLRREELALLSGVSNDYYVHLEQGRAAHVSDAILDALARVLALTEVEREHLGNLAHPQQRSVRPACAATVTTHVHQLLDLMSDVPALVIGRRMEVLAWNAPAEAVFGMRTMTSTDRTVARPFFLDADVRVRFLNWDAIATDIVGHLRLEAGKDPGDPLLASLVGELSTRSESFRRLWRNGDVKRKVGGLTQLNHPDVGELQLRYGVHPIIDQPFHWIIAYSYQPDSVTGERLRMLLSWHAASVPTVGEHGATTDAARTDDQRPPQPVTLPARGTRPGTQR